MSKWITKFLTEYQESRTDILDSMQGTPHFSAQSLEPETDIPDTLVSSHREESNKHPIPPLGLGWIMCWRDRDWKLRGGCEERSAGTVTACEWDGVSWLISLPNGDTVPIQKIVSVGMTDQSGRIIAAWTIREHGYDGDGPITSTRDRVKSEEESDEPKRLEELL